MKKLIAMYKSLPREMRTIIAMAGLGSPIGIVYALQRWVFPGVSTFIIILCAIGVVAFICLAAFIFSKIFGKGKRKRTERMAAELAGEPGGPTSMDVGAAIKENNEKFFSAVKDMRKNIGLSVYDLPWYITIGDSGCGKTKLINEGGLQFGMGKPEGYQLGTLNYNWWFSEDAVFIDMAGRLCNPRDDGDRREWESFLNTVAKGRKGYPINGVIVCVSAEHLLADPPEKIEQDANTTLERLRDLQTKLGVTFGTYLVITKCDKIVGFMQFFDRAESDIRVLNQMVGWSKPGEFNELFDPDKFSDDFNDIYRRLYDLRLRRLNDDSDEIDLGLAYCFPEEFRELRDPLQTYMRTLFPMIKNPRAIKNLLFRGIYFTSATREGGLVLKHLTERLGPEAAEQFQPLDLYPSKRPYFIRDLFFRKMFPEHGLVFRNEQEAVRNRKLSRLLIYGGIISILSLVALVIFMSISFNADISGPRMTVNEKADPATVDPPPPDAVVTSHELKGHAEELGKSKLAWFLSFGLGTDDPVNNINTIHAGLFDEHVMPKALDEIGLSIREYNLDPAEKPLAGQIDSQAALDYFDALTEYVRWHGCKSGSAWSGNLNYAGFEKMLKIIPKENTELVTNTPEFDTQASRYFETLNKHPGWKSPARHLDRLSQNSLASIQAAVAKVIAYFERYTRLNADHPEKVIREWMRIHNNLRNVDESYGNMLAFATNEPTTTEAMENLKSTYDEGFEVFKKALENVEWNKKIKFASLYAELLKMRERTWLARAAELRAALATCGLPESDGAYREIDSISEAAVGMNRPQGLDEMLWEQLAKAGLTTQAFDRTVFKDLSAFQAALKELGEEYRHIVTFDEQAADGNLLTVTNDAKAVLRVLDLINTKLKGATFKTSNSIGTLGIFLNGVEAQSTCEEDRTVDPLNETIKHAEWDFVVLRNLYNKCPDWIARARCGAALERLTNSLVNTGPLGVVQLTDDAADCRESQFTIATVSFDHQDAADEDDPQLDQPNQPQERKKKKSLSFGQKEAPAQAAPSPQRPRGRVVCVPNEIPVWAKPERLIDTSFDVTRALLFLNEWAGDKDDYLQPPSKGDLQQTAIALLNEKNEAYFDAYFRSWADAYSQKKLDNLQRLIHNAHNWSSLSTSLEQKDMIPDIKFELAAVGEILGAIPFCMPTDAELRRRGMEPTYKYWIAPQVRRDALNRHWGAVKFSQSANWNGIPNNAPGQAIGDRFASSFGDFAYALQKVPKQFPSPNELDQNPPTIRIPWPDFKKMRQDYSMEDEVLTQDLEEFESLVQKHLSAAIHDVLRNIERDSFAGVTAGSGWPFLNTFARHDGLSMPDTVEFRQFLTFLNRVGNAETYFRPLEAALPPSAEKNRRAAFYDQCQAWKTFLGLRQGTQCEPLGLPKFKVFDAKVPGNGIDNNGANYWASVQLNFGLNLDQQSQNIRFETRTSSSQKEWNAKWSWTGSRDKMTVRFLDGHQFSIANPQPYPDTTQSLGESKELWLCSLLMSGEPSDTTRKRWLVTYSFDIVAALQRFNKDLADQHQRVKSSERNCGLGMDIELDRPMPNAITPIR